MLPISRPTQVSEPVTAYSRRASASPAGGAAEGSSSAGVVSGVQPKEERLAGYLMARTAINQRVEGRDLYNLRVGHGTVQKVCDILPLGRANVIEDIQKAKKSLIPLRNLAATELTWDLMREIGLSSGEPTEIDFYRGAAATALHAKTGTCGHFAAITNPLQAAKLPQLKDTHSVVSQAQNKSIDHTWTEMMPKGRREDGTPILHGRDVVMDGWCKERLAVLREDSEFGRLDQNGNANHLTHHDFLDHKDGREALNAMLGFKARIDGSMELQNNFRKMIRELANRNVRPSRNSLRNDTSIFHADFREQAGRAVHIKAPSPGEGAGHDAEQSKGAIMADIQAVGVARSLGANIRGAVSEAPGIIASARDMFPDPR